MDRRRGTWSFSRRHIHTIEEEDTNGAEKEKGK
jgi:hypothetical protein